MALLQSPSFCPVFRAKQVEFYYQSPNLPKVVLAKSTTRDFRRRKHLGKSAKTNEISPKIVKKLCVKCSFSSSSNDNDRMAWNSNDNDSDYVDSSVVEAVEVRSGQDGFVIKMRDGNNLRCAHNNLRGGRLPTYAPHPAIVLKMEDGTGILLPIIVLEMPSILLMATLRNVQIARPTVYQVVKDMIEKMGYTVKLVRITKRVHEAYFAELHLVKSDDEAEPIVFDLRPSDAINIAVSCKAPIQVNKFLAYDDGVRIVEPVKESNRNSVLSTQLDRPTGKPCMEAKEFDLVRNMLIAAVEERYHDAALWRDKLTQLRSKRNST